MPRKTEYKGNGGAAYVRRLKDGFANQKRGSDDYRLQPSAPLLDCDNCKLTEPCHEAQRYGMKMLRPCQSTHLMYDEYRRIMKVSADTAQKGATPTN